MGYLYNNLPRVPCDVVRPHQCFGQLPRPMNSVFEQYLRRFVLVFFDDILVYSSNPHDHIHHLELVFVSCRRICYSPRNPSVHSGVIELINSATPFRNREYLPIHLRLKSSAIGRGQHQLNNSTDSSVLRATIKSS